MTAPVLSRLYGTEIEGRARRRPIFVLSRGRDVEHADHLHDDGHGHHHDHHAACLNTISCGMPLPRPAWSRSCRGSSAIFSFMRGQTFAGHALSHIGFAGATGAVLIGLAPLWGLVGFTVIAGIGMGLLGERISGRDVAIGVVLALALGFGLLFLHYYTAFATQATALLFGNVLAVDRSDDRHLGGARRGHACRARRDHAAAGVCQPAAGTGRSQGRADALRLDGISSPSLRWRSRNARRSSACCWCSR